MNNGFNRDTTEPYTNVDHKTEKEHYSDVTGEFIWPSSSTCEESELLKSISGDQKHR